MAAQALLWGDPIELTASGDLGGLAHYFNETAQALYIDGTDMATRLMITPEGQYSEPGAPYGIQADMAVSALRLDHPAFGILFATWVVDEEFTVAIYVYAADFTDILDNAEVIEQIDGPIKRLSLVVKNARADLFEHDMSLFAPGAGIILNLGMGDSEPYPMGRYFLDTGLYDMMAQTLQFRGRSRIGRLLKDTVFDTYGSATKAIFTGTPAEIVTEIVTLYSDGELTGDDLAVQTDTGSYSASFDPQKSVLDGLTEWLATFRTPGSGSYPELEYGDTGEDVEYAQTLLNNNLAPGQTPLVVDGIFGTKTRTAVRSFQRAKGLTVNGIIGESTWAALLGGQPGAWLLEELYDGRIVIGDAAFMAGYRPVDAYTFTLDQDVIKRSIDRSLDGVYRRVAVKYKSGESDAYVYSNVSTWPAWAVPTHRTHHIDAPEGATAAQAQALADKTAVELQYVGIGEELYGLIRPYLLVKDIAQITLDGITAVVTGLITEVKHTMGLKGFFTQFSSDSGGAIMEVEAGETVAIITAAQRNPAGGNRRRRLSDAILAAANRRTGNKTYLT